MKVHLSRTAKAAGAAGLAVVAVLAGSAVSASADSVATNPATWTSIPAATKAVGLTVPNSVSAQLAQRAVVQGSRALDGATADHPFYGYNGGTAPLVPASGSNVEAKKNEPDKNTYLVLRGQTGPDASYTGYGTHFVFAGHESGGKGALTRVNLDADDAHRVTLMAGTYADGSTLPDWDGSTWNPFAQRLLLTAEGAGNSTVSQATVGYPSKVDALGGVFGKAGWEGVQNDSSGNVWLADDSSGPTVATSARIPGGFIYRLLPVDKTDLTKGGKLQALQVTSNRTKAAIAFEGPSTANPTGGALTDDQKDLSTYGQSFATTWVTVHDTAVDGTDVFDANAAAKAKGATPFKRPENGVFRPGKAFKEFYFTATGDTNANSTADAGFGGWGGVYKVSQSSPDATTGTLSLVIAGDKEHTGYDNLTFLGGKHLAVGEDAGDTLHTQRAALDSAYVVDVTADYAKGRVPARFLAEGRDVSATIDSALTGTGNDGDNEITGIHASDGDPSTRGILGAKTPKLFEDGWRLFWSQQHGDNTLWEIVPASRHDD